MKNLRRIIVVITCVFLATIAHAQLNLGLKGGLNVSTLSGYKDATTNGLDDLSTLDVKSKAGFHAGLVAQFDIPFTNFFIQPELLFTSLGIKEEYQNQKENSNLNYIQVPIYAGYKINAGLGLNIILGVGPYFGYGISGSDITFMDENGHTYKEDIFKNSFKRFDFGFSAMGGIQYNKFQVTVGYDLGIVDLMNTPEWSTVKDQFNLSSISNRNVKVSLGYFF